MHLFNSGEFTLNSGRKSFFKIDTDALSDEDIECLARLIKDNLPHFSWVEGIPTGGLRLAEALKPLAEPDHTTIGLIIDDVCTSGQSLERYRNGRHDVMGAVIFARNRDDCPNWVYPIFIMDDSYTA